MSLGCRPVISEMSTPGARLGVLFRWTCACGAESGGGYGTYETTESSLLRHLSELPRSDAERVAEPIPEAAP